MFKGIIFDISKDMFTLYREYKGCEKLKNNKIFIICLFIMFVLFGIIVGIQLNTEIPTEGDGLSNPLNREGEVQEITDLRKANNDMKNKINELELIIDQYEQERIVESIPLRKIRSEMQQYKFLAGHSPASGPGMIITIEGMLEENIARIVEEKRYLVSLINELKIFGAEVISVNNIRLTGRSEITLAGSHINVNTIPVAPPYNIQVIGDAKAFKRYIEHQTFIFEFMKIDGLKVNIQYVDEIKIPSIVRGKPIQFLNTIEES